MDTLQGLLSVRDTEGGGYPAPKKTKKLSQTHRYLNFKCLVCTTRTNIKHRPISGQISLTPHTIGLFNSVTIT